MSEQNTITIRFPSEDDAQVAPYSLDGVYEAAEFVDRIDDQVDGDTVTLTVTLTDDAPEEAWLGVEALIDNWASSSGGVFA